MIYRDLHVSIMRFCEEFSNQFGSGVTPSFTNFDATWDEAELPKNDLIGYFALSFSIDDGIVEGSVQIGYSTLDDTNLFRLVNRIDNLLSHLKPTDKIPVYDADTGQSKGLLVIKNGTRVMPASGAKNRPVQFIAVSFVTTTTYALTSKVWESV